jgi:hypothetical protein
MKKSLTIERLGVRFGHVAMADKHSIARQRGAANKPWPVRQRPLTFFLRTPRIPKTNRLRPQSPSVVAQERRANWSCGQDCRQGIPPVKHVHSVAFRVVEGLQASQSLDLVGITVHDRDCTQSWPSLWRAALRERADLIPDRNGETRSKSPATSSLKLVALSISGRAAYAHFPKPLAGKSNTNHNRNQPT